MEFNSNTVLETHSKTSFIFNNSGTIFLTPRSATPMNSIMDLRMNMAGNSESISSPSSANATLSIEGFFHQTEVGTIAVSVTDQLHNTSLLNLVTNEYVLGTIRVVLSNDSTVVLPYYGGEYASNWTLMRLQEKSVFRAKIVSLPPGLKFGISSVLNQQVLTVNNLACADIKDFYSDISSLCYLCSLNASCSFSGSIDEPDGACVDKGSIPEHDVWQTCCSPSCGPSGKCTIENDNSEYFCKCANIMIGGSTCESLTEAGIGIIFAIAFILTFIAVVIFYKRYYNEQKTEILEELRQNLLTPAALNTNKKSAVSKQVLSVCYVQIICI